MRAALIVCCCTLLVAACAARETLVPKSAVIPAGVDFSGEWDLLDAATLRELDEPPLFPEATSIGNRRPPRSRDGGPAVQVFVETGRHLRITQTVYALFINFDRSVVEEYRFGEHREIRVGPVLADRVSGWEAGSYVVETLDEDGAKLIERLRLDDDRLLRDLRIVRGDKELYSLQQAFARDEDRR